MENCVEYFLIVIFLVQLIAQFPNLHAQEQDDQAGFISLDCGWPDGDYTDRDTGLRYNSDNDFIDTGVSRKVAPNDQQSNLTSSSSYQQFMYVRSFPNGTRNCYTFNSTTTTKVIKGKPFLIRGSFFYGNYDNISTNNSLLPKFYLQIGVDLWDTVQISSPSIPIRKEIIHRPNSDFIQVCLISTNTGIPFISALEIRPLNDTLYPIEFANLKSFRRFDFASSSHDQYRYKEDVYDRIWLPDNLEDSTSLTTTMPVMTNYNNYQVPNVVMNTANIPKNPNDSLVFSWDPDNITDKFYLFLHFAELSPPTPNELREFGIYVNGKPWGYPNYDPMPKYSPMYLQTETFWLLIEDVRSTTNYTLSLNRTMNSRLPPLLNAVELYTVIHASSSSQPTNDSDRGANVKRKKFLIPVLVVGIILIIIILTIIISLFVVKRIRNKVLRAVKTKPAGHDATTTNIPPDHDPRLQKTFKTENRQFTYAQVLHITNNLENVLGGGGFGKVYKGCVDQNTQVAVKILSQTSKQGYKEFQAEVKVLMSVHHKNLTSLVGYCYEGENMALIYEYMSNGTIEMYLSGKVSSVINWQDKLRISMDAAQGLEYLHNGCSPPIIHRDIKTSNILLDEKFRAKLSDFGLSRVFPTENATHITTELVAGTLGYHDPECNVTRVYTKRTDVYSFGIVMLEIVTGLAPQLKSEEFPHLIDWVKSVVVTGDITNIVDPRVKGDFDSSCMWKYVEVAMTCVSENAMSRPSMTDVVMELKECLEIEANRGRNNITIGGLDTTALLGPSAR